MVLVICAVKNLLFDLTSFVSKVIVDLVRHIFGIKNNDICTITITSRQALMKTTVLTLHHLHAKIMSISKNLLGLSAAITEVRGPWKPK